MAACPGKLCLLPFSMDSFSFDSVSHFLQQVEGAKSRKRQAVEEGLEPLLTDPATFAMSPEIATLVDKEVERYGDEALKQICIVALGKWLDYHQGILQEHIDNDAMAESLMTLRDISTLNIALRLLEEVGSFGGDEDYRSAMRKQINQAVLEKLEETGRDPEEVFNGDDKESYHDLL
jgi:hypothetical protein